jgi:riboflavin biosynthesis pyrimidine reductase
VRQIYPGHALLGEASLAALYAYPSHERWIRANMVASLDGAATVRGRTGGLSGEADRQVFALLRALADVILVGAGTVRVEGYGPVRPESEGVQWAWLRQGRPAAPPIAVITRRLHLDPDSPLLAGGPGLAPTIVITTEAAPAGQRAAVGRTAEVIIAGETEVDLGVAAGALVHRGYPHILTEGGPHLLGQITGAGLLDELCLTVSPLVTGPGAGRIVEAMGHAGQPDGREGRPLTLAHVIADDGYLLCRYVRSG